MIGIRSALLTATKGTVILDTQFDSYKPCVGAIAQREKGSLLGTESGVSNPYGIASAQERGRLFINSKEEIFKDMIIGVHQRPGDLHVRTNFCCVLFAWECHSRPSPSIVTKRSYKIGLTTSVLFILMVGKCVQDEAAHQHARGGQ